MKNAIRFLVLGMLLTSMAACAQLNSEFAGCFPEQYAFPTFYRDRLDPFSATSIAPSSSTTWSFAESSETSGCGSHSSTVPQSEEMFVAVAYDNLAQEMAQGGGHYLHALSQLMGCATPVYPEFAALTQRSYEALVPGGAVHPTVFLSRLRTLLAGETRLSAHCSNIS